jgi:hypothetical protein
LITIFISFTTAWWCTLKQIEIFYLFSRYDQFLIQYPLSILHNGLGFQKENGKVYVIEGNKGYFILFVQLQHTHPIAISSNNFSNKLQSSTSHMLFRLANLLLKICQSYWKSLKLWVFFLKVLKFKFYYYCLILEYYNNYLNSIFSKTRFPHKFVLNPTVVTKLF